MTALQKVFCCRFRIGIGIDIGIVIEKDNSDGNDRPSVKPLYWAEPEEASQQWC